MTVRGTLGGGETGRGIIGVVRDWFGRSGTGVGGPSGRSGTGRGTRREVWNGLGTLG